MTFCLDHDRDNHGYNLQSAEGWDRYRNPLKSLTKAVSRRHADTIQPKLSRITEQNQDPLFCQSAPFPTRGYTSRHDCSVNALPLGDSLTVCHVRFDDPRELLPETPLPQHKLDQIPSEYSRESPGGRYAREPYCCRTCFG